MKQFLVQGPLYPAIAAKLPVNFSERRREQRQLDDTVQTLSFSTNSELWSVFTPKRWVLIERLLKIGPCSMSALARAVRSDGRRVKADVTALIGLGVVERIDGGNVRVPFDRVSLDSHICAAD